MLIAAAMSLRRIALSPALLLALAASCSSASGSSSPSGPSDSGLGDSGSLQVAQSDLPRKPAAGISQATLGGAVTANNAFAFDLYGHLRSDPSLGGGNLLTSPISASLALTMAYAAAQGQTATEMAKALHYGAAAGSIFDGQNALSQALGGRAAFALAAAKQSATENQQPAPSPDDFQLQIVNSVWGEHTYPWAHPFLDVMAQRYGAGVYLEDFIHQPDPARLAINAWVSSETADKINDLLPPGAIDGTTRMVLVDAIHLKLPWLNPFMVSATASSTFTKSDGSKVTTSFMNQTQEWSYADDGKAQIVSLPLMGDQVAVVIALPHGDLETYEAGLIPSSLATPTATTNVQLSVPKLAFTSPTFSLAKSLKAMGMVQAFDSAAADFKGACPNPPDGLNLYVSDVLQKAMVAMQETGVEAAAATAVVLAGGGVPSQPVLMTVDRPFIFAIEDVTTGAILFLGRIEDPTQGG